MSTLAVAEQLAEELEGLETRAACLTKSRDTLRAHLLRTEHEALLNRDGPPASVATVPE